MREIPDIDPGKAPLPLRCLVKPGGAAPYAPKSDPCEALSSHGLLGMKDRLVNL